MKKAVKYTLYSLFGFLAFIVIYLILTFILSSITVDKDPNTTGEVEIFIKTNGVHTDLVVPAVNEQIDWTKEIRYANTALTDTNMCYLAFGWGDKGFYLETPEWKDLKFSVAANAAFGLGGTAIHATYYKNIKESGTCKRILISKDQYSRLINYISKTLQKDDLGKAIHIPTNANYNNADAFYEANGSYSMLKTCNTWANEGLKAAGQKACLWTAFDTGIFSKY